MKHCYKKYNLITAHFKNHIRNPRLIFKQLTHFSMHLREDKRSHFRKCGVSDKFISLNGSSARK